MPESLPLDPNGTMHELLELHRSPCYEDMRVILCACLYLTYLMHACYLSEFTVLWGCIVSILLHSTIYLRLQTNRFRQ